jgi:hypothetical protein
MIVLRGKADSGGDAALGDAVVDQPKGGNQLLTIGFQSLRPLWLVGSPRGDDHPQTGSLTFLDRATPKTFISRLISQLDALLWVGDGSVYAWIASSDPELLRTRPNKPNRTVLLCC